MFVGGAYFSSPTVYYQWWPALYHRDIHLHLDHRIDFTGSATGATGVGKVYILFLCNESDANVAPSVIYNSMLYFTDM